ncbi:hypothetical protein [Pseudomonas sp. DC3000-4b1]|uniref:hypothetical protein n=1 Tax=unclassified Pseudomonas TaxID=196821 RepID=UPI003CF2A457
MKRFKVLFMVFIETHRVSFVATEQIDTRHDDVNMRFTLDGFSGLLVIDPSYFWQMCFGVKIEFILLIGVHEKLFEFSSHRSKFFLWYNIFVETEREG